MTRFVATCAALFLATAPVCAGLDAPSVPYTDAQARAAAPVPSVNGRDGAVVVPTLCRQQSDPLPLPTTNPSAVSWTFPNAVCSFASVPTCFADLASGGPGYVFDQALNTTRTTTGVTYSFTAHANVLSVAALGSVNLTVGPPVNSTVILTCTAPPS